MSIFDGILICTDLDGTLLKNDGTISAENIEAINYFKENGGYFTFVTGRMPFFVGDFCNAIQPNAPIGCINGAGLYDHIAGKYIWNQPISNTVTKLIKCIDEAFPEVGIHVNTFDHTYFSKENITMEIFRRRTGLPNLVRDYNEIPEQMAKIIFGTEDEQELLSVEKTLLNHPMAKDFSFIRSEKTLFEILPKGMGKGVSIQKLTECLCLDKTIAIGDYNNDITMLKAAKIGVAVANAVPQLKAVADHITVSNEHNAIAQVILDLENGKFNI